MSWEGELGRMFFVVFFSFRVGELDLDSAVE